MTKKEICLNGPTIAYYSGLNGFEIKAIEYGADDYLIAVVGAWGGDKSYHRLKINYTAGGAAYVRLYGYKVPLDECVRC